MKIYKDRNSNMKRKLRKKDRLGAREENEIEIKIEIWEWEFNEEKEGMVGRTKYTE